MKRQRQGQIAAITGFLVTALAVGAEACEISSDVSLYYERAEQAILLMQYEDIVLRATDGKISCKEDRENARQICMVDGPGEMLVEADTGLFLVRMPEQDLHTVQVYASGDLSCGLAADFK